MHLVQLHQASTLRVGLVAVSLGLPLILLYSYLPLMRLAEMIILGFVTLTQYFCETCTYHTTNNNPRAHQHPEPQPAPTAQHVEHLRGRRRLHRQPVRRRHGQPHR